MLVFISIKKHPQRNQTQLAQTSITGLPLVVYLSPVLDRQMERMRGRSPKIEWNNGTIDIHVGTSGEYLSSIYIYIKTNTFVYIMRTYIYIHIDIYIYIHIYIYIYIHIYVHIYTYIHIYIHIFYIYIYIYIYIDTCIYFDRCALCTIWNFVHVVIYVEWRFRFVPSFLTMLKKSIPKKKYARQIVFMFGVKVYKKKPLKPHKLRMFKTFPHLTQSWQ